MTREEAVRFLLERPAEFGNMLGFNKLTDLHNDWIIEMIDGAEDETLQAHRGSYKTTCVSIALSIIIILLPRCRTLFMRKTDTDVKEVIRQVQNILKDPHTIYFVEIIYGVTLKLTVESTTEVSTNLVSDIKGTSQLVGMGIGGSITGKHFDKIFTDDIVNVKDRKSKAERDQTKLIYQELQNVKNRGGRIYNTGTPWHKDDAFSIMPNAIKYDCYDTGLISDEELQGIRTNMLASLFAANYELRHIASEDVIFTTPNTGADPALAEQGWCHIDAAYGGSDLTAFTIANKKNGKIYVLGKCWRQSVEEVEDEIIEIRKKFNAGKIYNEDNADKGFLGKELRKKGERVIIYHESMNKYYKITTYLKSEWNNVVFVDGTDDEYINQICDYNENAEHDDCPDSLASLIRALEKTHEEEYQPLWN